MNPLLDKQCRHCTPGTPPLTPDAARELLQQTPRWQVGDSGGEIRREFRFRNFHETMAFVNALAWIAHQQDHHPDLEVGYNRCEVRYSTHSIGGLSENDFICAAKIDTLC